MKQKHEDEARKEAEEFNESTERKLQHVLELTEMMKECQHEKLKNNQTVSFTDTAESPKMRLKPLY